MSSRTLTAGSCSRVGRGLARSLDGISPHCNMSLGFPKMVNREGNPARIAGTDPVLVRLLELGKLGKCGRVTLVKSKELNRVTRRRYCGDARTDLSRGQPCEAMWRYRQADSVSNSVQILGEVQVGCIWACAGATRRVRDFFSEVTWVVSARRPIRPHKVNPGPSQCDIRDGSSHLVVLHGLLSVPRYLV